MIYPSFISTVALSQETRQSISRLQTRLVEAQTELQTGRHADVGLTLGAKTGVTVALRQDLTQLQTIRDSNNLVSTRMKASQQSLQNISDQSQNFLAAVVRAKSTSLSDTTVIAEAVAGMNSLNESLNASLDGQFLFAGINSDVRPVDQYFDDVSPASRQAVAAAFQAKFGFDQSSPNVSTITPAAMQDFLDNEFAALFADPAWGTNWSYASDGNVRSRISRSEIADVSTSANQQPFRDLTAALVMFSDMGYANMTEETRGVLADKAMSLVNSAVGAISNIQSTLGVTQERLSKSTDVLGIQINLITGSINDLEGVDPNEVATRLSTLMTQMESAYAVTKRIHDLSIIDYL